MKKKELSASEHYRHKAWEYFSAKNKFEQSKKELDVLKEQFEETMLECCMHEGKKKLTFGQLELSESKSGYSEVLKVTKVEKTTIEWLIDKLKRRLPAKIMNRVVKKQYSINNMTGLCEYLKSCGVDPKVFKRYVTVLETVDETAIERLSELGEITPKQISGCYLVKCSKPYFKLTKTMNRAEGGDVDENE